MREMRLVGLSLLAALLAAGCGGNGASDAGAASPEAVPRAPGAARIVLGRSIGPARVGITADEVRSVIGQPTEIRPSDLHAGWERWRYRDRGLTLTVTEIGEVWDVRTRSDRYRSNRGLRVGLREGRVRQRLPNADCRPYGGPARYRRWRVCMSASNLDGPHTRVLLIRGVAREIRVARGLAL